MSVNFNQIAVPGVQGLHPYQPGKPESELRREYGLEDNDVIVKLASNENPLGPSPAVTAAISDHLAELARYPDGNGFELKNALADYHGIEPGAITLGNGSNDVLELVARALVTPAHEVLFSEHAFAVYPLVTQAIGARPCVAPAVNTDQPMAGGHDLAAFAELLSERTRLVFIANPNNPTGTWLAAEELRAFLERVPGEVIVVVDEAYVEYVDEPDYRSVLPWLAEFANLVVTRTFSKAYGLAGLRVGYSVCHPDLANLLNRVRQPFNVNHLALVAATAALADRSYIRRSAELNRLGLQQLRAGLDEQGLRYLNSVANFLCIDTGQSGQTVFEALLPKGVIVRPIANYGLSHHLRVSVGTETENRRFLQALSEVLGC